MAPRRYMRMLTNVVESSSSLVPQAHPVLTAMGCTLRPRILATSAPVARAQSVGASTGTAGLGFGLAAGTFAGALFDDAFAVALPVAFRAGPGEAVDVSVEPTLGAPTVASESNMLVSMDGTTV